MPEMDYSTQAAQAKLSANAARAAEARMRSEGTDVASPEGMEMEEDELEGADEDDEAPEDDLPNASLESVPDISPEEEAALHGADGEAEMHAVTPEEE
jgi:hypothetical protein